MSICAEWNGFGRSSHSQCKLCISWINPKTDVAEICFTFPSLQTIISSMESDFSSRYERWCETSVEFTSLAWPCSISRPTWWQSGTLSLVQIHPDTVLSLVEIMVLPSHPKPPTRGISYLSLCLYGKRGGFHARKGSIKGAGVSNIMIPPTIDYFCACQPITVSSC